MLKRKDMKRQEIIDRLEGLMIDFNSEDKYVLTRDMLEYKTSIAKYFGSKYHHLGDIIVIFTDSYGMAGFITMAIEYNEAVETYVDSLEPDSKEEKTELLMDIGAMYFTNL
jgi:hypothetical protein